MTNESANGVEHCEAFVDSDKLVKFLIREHESHYR